MIRPYYKHGLRYHPLYSKWKSMRARCNNPNDPRYKNYGARNIKVCSRWEDFNNFLDDMGLCPMGMGIDRIDNSKGYSPDNCRWATQSQQLRNNRRTRLISYKGMTMCAKDWAKKTGIDYVGFLYRIKNWSIKRAVTEAIH
jgi:hypothetical protein